MMHELLVLIEITNLFFGETISLHRNLLQKPLNKSKKREREGKGKTSKEEEEGRRKKRAARDLLQSNEVVPS